MKLEQLSNKLVAVVKVDDPVDLAVRHMWQLNIRHLPVIREAVPVGIISDRDVLLHACWADAPASGTSRIDQIMTTPIVALSPDDPIEKAARLMLNKRINSVPLVAGNSIVGIVTETDFLRCFNDDACTVPSLGCRKQGVADYMARDVARLQPSATTHDAIQLMRNRQIHHVPIIEDGKLVGIISDRDVLRGCSREIGERAISVAELRTGHAADVRGLMSRHVESLGPTATLSIAAEKMVAHRIGALPIVEDESLAGIITETDLLRALVDDCEA